MEHNLNRSTSVQPIPVRDLQAIFSDRPLVEFAEPKRYRPDLLRCLAANDRSEPQLSEGWVILWGIVSALLLVAGSSLILYASGGSW